LVYSRRKSCVKRKLNFDDGGDDVVSKTKPSKSCWVMLVVVRINEMLGYACGCVAVGGRITDSVVICFLVCRHSIKLNVGEKYSMFSFNLMFSVLSK
jgi:hypothetical protein